MAATEREKLYCMLEFHVPKSVITMQRALHLKFKKDTPNNNSIRTRYNQLSETGCLCKQSACESTGCPSTLDANIECLHESFAAHQTKLHL